MSSINEYSYYKCFENKMDCCIEDELVAIKGICSEDKLSGLLTASDTTWTQFYIPEILEIPEQKPDIEQVVSVYAAVKIISQKVVKTPVFINPSTGLPETIQNQEGTIITGRKLVIEGFLTEKIIYTADVEEQSIHSAHFNVPFSVFIILPVDSLLSDKFKIEPCIEDIFICRTTKRNVFKNTTIFIKATLLGCK